MQEQRPRWNEREGLRAGVGACGGMEERVAWGGMEEGRDVCGREVCRQRGGKGRTLEGVVKTASVAGM